MRYLLIISLLFTTAYSQVYVRTGKGKVKLGQTTQVGDSLVVSATATVDTNVIATKYYVSQQSGGSVDTTTLFAGKLGGWVDLWRTADTATGTFTFVNLGQLQFTMTASAVYEIDARIYMNRSNTANGYTIALNCGGTPTNVGIIGGAPNSTTAGTDLIKTDPITTGTDSLQIAGTTVTTTEYADFKGILTCDGSNRLFTFRVRSEVSASAITYKRGSWLRYRRLY